MVNDLALVKLGDKIVQQFFAKAGKKVGSLGLAANPACLAVDNEVLKLLEQFNKKSVTIHGKITDAHNFTGKIGNYLGVIDDDLPEFLNAARQVYTPASATQGTFVEIVNKLAEGRLFRNTPKGEKFLESLNNKGINPYGLTCKGSNFQGLVKGLNRPGEARPAEEILLGLSYTA